VVFFTGFVIPEKVTQLYFLHPVNIVIEIILWSPSQKLMYIKMVLIVLIFSFIIQEGYFERKLRLLYATNIGTG
jgi:hypothetical protein